MKKIYLFAIVTAAFICSCSCSRNSNIITIPVGNGGAVTLPEPAPGRLIMPVPENGNSARYMPKATVFRMTGDYADHVAVTIGPNGMLTYFPAPSDISADSAPVSLGDGWYLNRQGLGSGSVFTKWTFEEYSKLSKVPSPEEIKAAIIPSAAVCDFKTLPVSASEATKMTPEELLKLL